eukprot:scaffold719_cov359-Prasinococcus_capsulatus_cf.AAC.15
MWVQLKYLLERKIASLGGDVSFHRKPMSGYFSTLFACQVLVPMGDPSNTLCTHPIPRSLRGQLARRHTHVRGVDSVLCLVAVAHRFARGWICTVLTPTREDSRPLNTTTSMTWRGSPHDTHSIWPCTSSRYTFLRAGAWIARASARSCSPWLGLCPVVVLILCSSWPPCGNSTLLTELTRVGYPRHMYGHWQTGINPITRFAPARTQRSSWPLLAQSRGLWAGNPGKAHNIRKHLKRSPPVQSLSCTTKPGDTSSGIPSHEHLYLEQSTYALLSHERFHDLWKSPHCCAGHHARLQHICRRGRNCSRCPANRTNLHGTGWGPT